MFSVLWKEFKEIITEFISDKVQITPLISEEPSPVIPIPQCGIDLIEDIEDCKLIGYLDPAGVPTDGYGNTHGAKVGVVITQAKADADLARNLSTSWAAILRNVKVPLTQSQYGGLLSFTFNTGETAFSKSTLLKKVNASDTSGVIAEFKKWTFIHVDGKPVVSNGLIERRRKEAALYAGGDWRVS